MSMKSVWKGPGAGSRSVNGGLMDLLLALEAQLTGAHIVVNILDHTNPKVTGAHYTYHAGCS